MSTLDRDTTRSVVLGLSIIIAGALIGLGVTKFRTDDRYVTVKGISEREVKADLAIWPIRLVAANNELSVAHASIQTSVRRVREFLAKNGVDTSQIALQDFGVSDALANQYGGAERATTRYVIKQTLVVRSTNPDKLHAASQNVADLVNAGVVVQSGGDYGSGGPTFLFTKLSDLKPQMIGEATARAREAAEKFAADSRTSLGGIRTATQGLFEIQPRDDAPGITEGSQMVKKVRVVATVEYFLR